MRVLFVTPSQISSGEAITALSMAESVVANGGSIRFLASPFTAGFLQPYVGGRVKSLTDDVMENQRRWRRLLSDFEPEAVIFADYPLLFFPSGISPLADDGWCQELEQGRATLLTLDHLGYAQKPLTLFFGPPHLSMQSATIPPLPEAMQVLLPCPGQAPAPVPGRRGIPFRYWELPLAVPEPVQQATRDKYLADRDSCLIFHSVSSWAVRFAEHFDLPFYGFLSSFLDYYLQDSPRPVTVVSVNNGHLLQPLEREGLRICNLSALARDDYERLMFASDLMLTENRISVSLGKMACSLTPCAVLRNSYRLRPLLEKASGQLRELVVAMERRLPGAIFPWEVFPIWGRAELDELGICEGNTLYRGVASLELFGGETTRQKLQALLFDGDVRAGLRKEQAHYISELKELATAYTAISVAMGRG